MKKKPNWLRNFQKGLGSASSSSLYSLKKIHERATRTAKEFDKRHGISSQVERLKEQSFKQARELEAKYKIRNTGHAVSNMVRSGIGAASDYAEDAGIKNQFRRVSDLVKLDVLEPVAKSAKTRGIQDKLDSFGKSTIALYGATRAWIKPYWAPETPDELLRNTRQELIFINACILQISRDEAEQLAYKLGNAVVSKIAGVASAGALLGMVSTFGSASTGTAIATLHGAAATNATFYWVGSLLGGGVATGAFLTGGFTLAVGYGVYRLLSSKAREFEELSEAERHVIEASGFLIAAIGDLLEHNSIRFSVDEAELLLQNTLKPLHTFLVGHSDEIRKNLDARNDLLFKEHAIVDFQKVVLDGFKSFISEENNNRRYYPEYVIGGVIYALLTSSAVDDSRESQLALEAIRRMKTDWSEAGEVKIGSDLSELSSEQLKGVANNAKGIYHEILFVDDYNHEHRDSYAELFGATNHPGADIRIVSTSSGELIDEIQLKATSSETLVQDHLERYPDIKILATEEVALGSTAIDGSGIYNLQITKDIDQFLEKLADNSPLDRATESAELSGLVAAGREAIKSLSGKQSASRAAIETVKATTVTATSTAIVAYLFS